MKTITITKKRAEEMCKLVDTSYPFGFRIGVCDVYAEVTNQELPLSIRQKLPPKKYGIWLDWSWPLTKAGDAQRRKFIRSLIGKRFKV